MNKNIIKNLNAIDKENKSVKEILSTLKTRKAVGKVKDGVNLVGIVEKLVEKKTEEKKEESL